MSTTNNTHATSVASATSSSNHHPHPSNSRRSSGSGGAAAGAGGGGGGRSNSGGGASSGSTTTTTTTTTTTATTTATPACAACKYQRRKCNPDCTLAPYFPADHQRQFLNAHRLFGVSNILKTLRVLDTSQRAAAMGSIIFQSNARAQDPVGGCYRIILELQRQIDRDSAELELVLRQLAICRAQAQQQPQPTSLPTELNVASTINLIDQADVDAPNPEDDVVGIPTLLQQQQQEQEQQQQQQQYLYYYFGGGDDGGDDHPHGNNDDNSCSITIKDHGAGVEPAPASPFLVGQQYHRQQCDDDDDDVKPPVELFDVRHHQTFLVSGDDEDDTKDASPNLDYRSTASLELKDAPNSMEQLQEHDLKSVASLLKLTNCDSAGM